VLWVAYVDILSHTLCYGNRLLDAVYTISERFYRIISKLLLQIKPS